MLNKLEATEATTEEKPETAATAPAESTTETAASTTISEGNETIMKETKQEVKATTEAAEKPETGADKIAKIVTLKARLHYAGVRKADNSRTARAGTSGK